MLSRLSRTRIFVGALTAVIFAGGFIFTGRHFENYFPLQEGLSLEYNVKRSKDGEIVEQAKEKVTNLAAKTLEGKKVVPRKYEVKDEKNVEKTFMGFFHKDNEGVMLWATQAEKDGQPNLLSTPFYYVKNPLEVGTVWGSGEGPKGAIESISETVTVPAGTFKKCVKVKITYPPNMAMSEGFFWFAERIGIVKSSYVYKNSMKEEFQLLSIQE